MTKNPTDQMTTEELFDEQRNEFADRLGALFGLPEDLLEEVRNQPMRVDEDPEVNRMREEWIRHCAKVDRGEF